MHLGLHLRIHSYAKRVVYRFDVILGLGGSFWNQNFESS